MDANNKNGSGPQNGPRQGWEDPSYAWEQMQGGIFDKIQAQDPDFFKKDRKRRPIWWFWLAGLGMLVLGLAFGLGLNQEPADAPPSGKDYPAPAIVAGAEQLPSKEEICNDPPEHLTEVEKTAPSIVSTDSRQASAAPEKEITERISVPETPLPPINKPVFTPDFSSVKPLQGIAITGLNSKTAFLLPELPKPGFNKAPASTTSSSGWKVLTYAGLALSPQNYRGTSPIADFRNNNTDHYTGYAIGIKALAPTGKRSFLLMGVEQEFGYQYLDVYIEREVEVLKENALLSVTNYLVGSHSVHVYGDTTVAGLEKTRLAQYNEFVTSRISLGWGMQWENKNWQFRPQIALVGGWLNRASGRTIAEDYAVQEYNNDNPIYSRWQLMSSAGVDVEKQISSRMGLFVGYQFNKQWNNASVESDLTLRPAFHRLSAGITFTW
jgi:hypothetical protein